MNTPEYNNIVDVHTGIVSSTGSVGAEARGDNRLYWNWPHYVTDSHRVTAAFKRLSSVHNFKPERNVNAQDYTIESGKRRDVMRFISSPQVVRELLVGENAISSFVEVAVPILEDEWYVMLAKNGERRRSMKPLEEMIEETSNPPQSIRSPIDAIRRVRAENLSFQTHLLDEKTRDDVFGLWSDPFGWTKKQVATFADNLAEQKKGTSGMWFTGLQKEDPDSPTGKTIVAASMAEKITFTGKGGHPLDIIELTEWSVGESYRRNGYMAATVSHLTAQVLDDYWKNKRDLPFIIAECNIPTYAFKSGFAAGLRVPERNLEDGMVPQILKQNVTVGDGLQPEGLRDFAFMYLPPSLLVQHYSPELLDQVV